MQVLKQVQLNVIVSNSFNNTWSYKSDKSLFLSFRISVGLQSMILPTTLVNDIKKGLTVNASNIIPSGFLLTDEGFMILGFQPNCKYTRVKILMMSKDQKDLIVLQNLANKK